MQHAGAKPISLLWIDTNMDDDVKENCRSLVVIRESAASEKLVARSLQRFCSVHCHLLKTKMLGSLMVTIFWSRREKILQMQFWDISRAHFFGTAQIEIYLDLPDK